MNFKPGMKVSARFGANWYTAYIYESSTDRDGIQYYKVKRRDWNEYAVVLQDGLRLLSRGAVYAENKRYQIGDQVEALQGDTWYKATVQDKLNDLYHIKYEGYDEWDWVGDEDLKQNQDATPPLRPGSLPDQGVSAERQTHYVVILKGSGLYRINPTDGSFVLLSPDWMRVRGMAAAGRYVYVVAEETLYRIHIEDGRYETISKGWTDFGGIAAL